MIKKWKYINIYLVDPGPIIWDPEYYDDYPRIRQCSCSLDFHTHIIYHDCINSIKALMRFIKKENKKYYGIRDTYYFAVIVSSHRRLASYLISPLNKICYHREFKINSFRDYSYYILNDIEELSDEDQDALADFILN